MKKQTKNDLDQRQAEVPFKLAPLAQPDHKVRRMGYDPIMIETSKDPIVIRVSLYKGKTRISIRYHYWGHGDLLHPTKRGIEIPLDHVVEARNILNHLIHQAGLEESNSTDQV